MKTEPPLIIETGTATISPKALWELSKGARIKVPASSIAPLIPKATAEHFRDWLTKALADAPNARLSNDAP